MKKNQPSVEYIAWSLFRFLLFSGAFDMEVNYTNVYGKSLRQISLCKLSHLSTDSDGYK